MKRILPMTAVAQVSPKEIQQRLSWIKKVMVVLLTVLLLASVSLQKAFGQTTIVNYDFNAGASFAALTPSLAANITSAATGSGAFTTTTGTASGSGAFVANTAGNSLRTTINNSWTFTLGGTNLASYKTFKVYYQAQKSSIGTNTFTVSYSKNGAAFTSTGITATTGANPLSITTLLTASWSQAVLTIPTAADNPTTSLAFRITVNNASSGNVQLDNFQVQAVSPLQVTAFSGNTLCSGATGQLTMTTSGGTAPYTVVYNDGTANRTVTGVASGTAFNAVVNPTATTNYTLVSVTDSKGLSRTTGFTDAAATVTVNPVPTVNAVNNQAICKGSATTAITFSGAVSGTTYSWTNNTTSIGLAASGTGNIAAFTPVNNGTTAVTATITVTPTANGCTGTAKTFTITVNPVPTVNAITNQVVCKGSSVAAISFTGTIAGTIYNWTNNNTAIGLAASGSGNTNAFTAANNTTAAIVSTVTVTPTLNGCTGTAKTFTVTVNPSPTATASASVTAICGGGTTSLSSIATSATPATPSFSSTSTGTIPNNSATGISKTIAASGLPTTMASLTNISVTMTLTHTNDADIEAYLIRPGGTLTNAASGTLLQTPVAGGSICLAADRGGSGDNFTTTVFSDAAATAIGSGVSPFTGTFKPENAFSTLTGNPNGTWTLKVLDDASATSGGAIASWSIKFTYNNGLSYTWSSTPAGFTSALQNPGNVSPAVSTTYNLLVTDLVNNCTAQSSVAVTAGQTPTTAVAGNPQTISLAVGNATLAANTPVVGTGAWSVVSGPSTSTAQFSSIASPTAIFTPAGGTGLYNLRWTISSVPCTASTADVAITVNAANVPPVANAGNDTTIVVPAGSVVLNASTSTDIDGTITSYLWKKLSGSQNYQIANPGNAVTALTNLTEGLYTFELTVTDNSGAVSTDVVNVNVVSRILIDLGSTITASPDATGRFWNNVTIAQPGIQLQNAVTTNNSPTTIGLEVVNRIDGTYNVGGPGTNTGNTIGDVGDYPASVTTDFAFAEPSATNGSWKINGLDSLKQYTIKFWGTRSVDDNRILQIKRSDESVWQEYDGGNNTDYNRAAYFTFNGKTNISFDIRVKSGNAFAYISVIDISRTSIPSILLPPAKDSDMVYCGTPYKIVVLGSSTAYGTGATPVDSSWVNKFTAYMKRKNAQNTVINLGIPAFTTYNALCPDGFVPPANRPAPVEGYNISEAIRQHPDAIIINLPTNDAVNNYSVAEQQANYERAIALAKAAGISVWVTTTQPRTNLTSAQVDNLRLMRDWTYTRFGKKAIDFWSTVANADGSIGSAYNFDNTHVNNAGHDIFYKRVLSETILDFLCNPINQAPVARAGNDISLVLPATSTTLKGGASTDEDGSITSYQWTKISGPAQFNLSDASAIEPDLTNLVEGVYAFELKVTDDSLATAKDTVLVTISQPVNAPPVAKAGSDASIIIPASTGSLNGTASSDIDGTITTYLWTKIGGPSNYLIADATSASTAISNLSEGVYSFELKVTDDRGDIGKDTVNITVGNRILVDIGASGTSTTSPDANGKYWNNMTNAQAGIRLQNAVTTNNVATTLSIEVVNRIDGTFDVDGLGISGGNTAGIVGDYPASATVDYAFASPSTTTGSWKVSGLDPLKQYSIKFWGTKTAADRFTQIKRSDETVWQEYDAGNNTDYNRAATFTFSGKTEQSFDIRVKSGYTFGYISVVDITVAYAVNVPPVAKAGNDVTVMLPANSTTLNGTASSDPNGSITAYSWTKISGPATYSFSDSTIAQPVVSNLAEGAYQFELTVTDNSGAQGKDTVAVTISVPVNIPPVANAGADASVILPANSVSLNGTASSDVDGTITNYQWTKVAGPASFQLVNATSASASATNLAEGIYSFELSVTDNSGATKKDTVIITVSNRVLVDIGSAGTATASPDANGKYWNNMTNAQVGVRLQNAVTTTNTATTIGLEVVNRIDGTFDETGLGVSGANGVGAVGDYPANATADYAFAFNNTTTGNWKFTGLDATKQYTIKFWGTKNAADRFIEIKRADETTWKEYDAGNNTDYNRGATFTFSGKTEQSFDIRVKAGYTFGYISVIDITMTSLNNGGSFASRSATPAAATNAKSAVTLSKPTAMSIYPNPSASGDFTIAVAGAKTGTVKVEIVNSLGQPVYQRTEKNSNGLVKVGAEARLTSGVYIVTCIINGEKISNRLVISK